MNPAENQIEHLLERTRQQLNKPFSNVQRSLLYVINATYLCLTPIYLFSERWATGSYVPDARLWFIYGFVWFTNLFSGIYTFCCSEDGQPAVPGRSLSFPHFKRRAWLETTLRWLSVLSVMLMSVAHLIGVGNPSSDALLTDFALAHSLIVLAAMVLGQRAMLAWALVVLGLLMWVTFGQLGYSYRFNYLTPTESARYEQALAQRQGWALNRQAVLKANHLNSPRASRYFNTWLVYVIVATATAYFFAGVALDLFAVIPKATDAIKEAIHAAKKAEERRLLAQQEILSTELKALKAQVNPHFLYNTLNYFYIRSLQVDQELAESIIKLSDIMRYGMREDFNTAKLPDEINCMKQYISLHQLRYAAIHIDFTVGGEVEQKHILPFLLIGLVENAFKHGNMTDSNYPFVIRIRVTDDRIDVYTSNLKNKKKRVESNHIGLANMRQRLELAYENRYTFNIDDKANTFSCRLIIYS